MDELAEMLYMKMIEKRHYELLNQKTRVNIKLKHACKTQNLNGVAYYSIRLAELKLLIKCYEDKLCNFHIHE